MTCTSHVLPPAMKFKARGWQLEVQHSSLSVENSPIITVGNIVICHYISSQSLYTSPWLYLQAMEGKNNKKGIGFVYEVSWLS